MNYLDFVIENYIWFIVGGVVLIMVVIGYFAEKTNFGKPENKERPKKHKEEAKSKKGKKREETVDVVSEIPETIAEEEIPEQTILEEPMENLENVDIEAPMSNEDVIEEPMADLENVDIEETIGTEVDQTEAVSEEIPEDLYAGLDGTPNAYKPTEEESNPIDMDLPNIDALKEDLEEAPADDDDIWRF